jgi:hypothetical protein
MKATSRLTWEAGSQRRHVYEVVRCLPDPPDIESLYRLRSTINRSERVVREGEIKPVQDEQEAS